MAVIGTLNVPDQVGAVAPTFVTLTAADTLPYSANKVQVLMLVNPTGASITANIKGDAATNVIVPELGTVSVSAGLNVVVASNGTVLLPLGKVRGYLSGAVVNVTGGTGLRAVILEG